MNVLPPLCALTVLLGLCACTKEDLNPDIDTLIFGHFYGECVGERCVETYKLEAGHLYEDVLDRYAGGDHKNFGFQPLPDTLFDKVMTLPSAFPEKLMGEPETIGMPDAGDWGGIYIQIRRNGQNYWWLIDKQEDNLPSWLLPFKQDVESAILKLP